MVHRKALDNGPVYFTMLRASNTTMAITFPGRVLKLVSGLAVLLLAGPAARAQSQTTPFDAGTVAATQAQPPTNDFFARARDLVGQMTLDEKITELHGNVDSKHLRYVPPIPRLGIPGFRIANGPAGVGPADEHKQVPATALPAPILLAASWDPALAQDYGVVAGREARSMGDDLLESPDINIARVPQNGRTFEAFGEDPYLVAQMSVAEIKGIQSQGEIANVKHYAANNQEINRSKINVIVDQRTLREIYLPAFEASVKQGHVASLMSAYNKVNGDFCCQNDELQNVILKREWGFDGFITSDFGAVHSTVPCALAGLDLEMPTGKYFGDALKAAVQSGEVPMSVIDDKLIRRFRMMMAYGLFDHPPKLQPIPAQKDGAESRRIAEEGMVLLKNDGNLLPLDPNNIHSIAVIGPSATNAMSGGGGSSHVVPLYTVSPVDGLQQRAGSQVNVQLNDGSDISNAVALAKAADVAIVMVRDTETEGKDHGLTLLGNQDDLVQAVAAANPHTIVVLKTGSAVLMPWVDDVPAILEAWYPGEEDGHAVAAVLFGDVNPSGKLPLTFPKQLEDLPANTPEQYPGTNGQVVYSEGIFVGYRHYDANNIAPLFPFGYGLSYTTFAYTNLALTFHSKPVKTIYLKDSDTDYSKPLLDVELNVANTGNRVGEEVVQLYLGLPATQDIPQPPAQLKHFAKIPLAPGNQAHIRFELNGQSLACWDSNYYRWTILPGTYRVMIGSSSRDIRLAGTFTVQRGSRPMFHWFGSN
jgi:beta-glucosidase